MPPPQSYRADTGRREREGRVVGRVDIARSIGSMNFASPSDLPPAAGYSHVVTIPSGRLVWTSGQIGMAADGSVASGWEAQTRLTFENVGRALAAGGAGWADVVKLTFYVVSTDSLTTV